MTGPVSESAAEGLVAENITVRYGGVTANADVSIAVPPGALVGLIGPNGAGKTSLIDALSGFTAAEGSMTLDGRRIDRLSAHRRRRAGMARTWQAGELFDSLTVRENVLVAARPIGWRSIGRDLGVVRRDRDDGQSVLDALGLGEVAERNATELSLGTQRLVGVARAMAGGSRTLLLDEPAAGLDTRESRRLGERLQRLTETGPGILLVDHDVELVFAISTHVYVMDFGRIIASGPAATVRKDPKVLAAYLGAEASTETVAEVV